MNNFECGRYRVRPMTKGDLEIVFAWRVHDEIRKFMYTQHRISEEEHASWYERASQDPNRRLLIFESARKPLGFVSFTTLAGGRSALWGFYAAPGAPRGTGRRLGHAALQHAYETMQMHKILGEALAYNERSIRTHRYLGFREEGVLREHYFDGQSYHDIVCFGLLSHEWRNAKPET